MLELSAAQSNLNIKITTVFQAYNVLQLADLFEFLLPFKSQLCPLPNLNYVQHPAFLKPAVLPRELRQKAADRIIDFLSRHQTDLSDFSSKKIMMENFVKTLLIDSELDQNLFPRFLEYTKKLDSLRKQSLGDFIPEFQPYLSMPKSLPKKIDSQFNSHS